MRSMRNVAIFIGMLVLVVFAVSAVLLPIQYRLIDGGNFVSYFGWLSWAHAAFPLLLAALFLVAGALLALLLRTRAVARWAIALGVCYSVLRLMLTSESLTGERPSFLYVWAGIELLVPAVAAWAGARLAGRARIHRIGDATAP
jgi:hypothetical protein